MRSSSLTYKLQQDICEDGTVVAERLLTFEIPYSCGKDGDELEVDFENIRCTGLMEKSGDTVLHATSIYVSTWLAWFKARVDASRDLQNDLYRRCLADVMSAADDDDDRRMRDQRDRDAA